MKREKVSRRDIAHGLLLLLVLAVLLSFAGTSDMENHQVVTKEAALFQVER